jgi:hypothetical protein
MGTIARRRRMAFAVLAVFWLCASGPVAALELPASDAAPLPDALAPVVDTGITEVVEEAVEQLAAPLVPAVETLPAVNDAGVPDPALPEPAPMMAPAPPAAPGPARGPAPEHRVGAPPSPLAEPAAGTAAPARDADAAGVQQGGQRRPSVVQAAADFSLPLGIAATVIAFLLVQARLDRHDPKLLAASSHRGDALPFS